MSNQAGCIATIQIPFNTEPFIQSTKTETSKDVWVSEERTSPEASPRAEYSHDPTESLPAVVRFLKRLKNAVFPNIDFVSHHNVPSCHNDYQVLIEYGLETIESAGLSPTEVETSAHVLEELVNDTREKIPKKISKLIKCLCTADGSRNFVQSLLFAHGCLDNSAQSRVWKIGDLFQCILEFTGLSDVFGSVKCVCKRFRLSLSTLPNENSCGRRILKNRWSYSDKKSSVLTELDTLVYERGTEPDHAFSYICQIQEKPPDIHWLVNILRACMLGHRQASHQLLQKFANNNQFYDELIMCEQYFQEQFSAVSLKRAQEIHPYTRPLHLPTTLLALNGNWTILHQICKKLSRGNLNRQKASIIDEIIYDLCTISPAKEALSCWELFLQQGWTPRIVGVCNEWSDVLDELNNLLRTTFPEYGFVLLSEDEETSKRAKRKECLAKSMQELSRKGLLIQDLDQWVNGTSFAGFMRTGNYDMAVESVGFRIPPLI